MHNQMTEPGFTPVVKGQQIAHQRPIQFRLILNPPQPVNQQTIQEDYKTHTTNDSNNGGLQYKAQPYNQPQAHRKKQPAKAA